MRRGEAPRVHRHWPRLRLGPVRQGKDRDARRCVIRAKLAAVSKSPSAPLSKPACSPLVRRQTPKASKVSLSRYCHLRALGLFRLSGRVGVSGRSSQVVAESLEPPHLARIHLCTPQLVPPHAFTGP
jgi:hypothetical protein